VTRYAVKLSGRVRATVFAECPWHEAPGQHLEVDLATLVVRCKACGRSGVVEDVVKSWAIVRLVSTYQPGTLVSPNKPLG
jgi:hypothetical protein